MTSQPSAQYPPEAYAPDGTLWWKLRVRPGTTAARFGDEQKIAAYLAYNVGTSDTFTMRSLRAALGSETVPNDAEHLNRRLRTLRNRDEWRIASQRDDGSLAIDEYRVERVGWYPGCGRPRPVNDVPSDKVRRAVFERDHNTCQICFTVAGEPYVDLPDKIMRPTLGHRIPGKRLSRVATVDELQTECARCNESIRDELFDPVTLAELLPSIRGLRRTDKTRLFDWITQGVRPRVEVEIAYAHARRLSEHERSRLLNELRTMVNR